MKKNFKNKVLTASIVAHNFVLKSASASSNTAAIKPIYDWLLDWCIVAGVGIIIWGSLTIALAYKSDDSHAMEKGIKTAIAGVMATSIKVVVAPFLS